MKTKHTKSKIIAFLNDVSENNSNPEWFIKSEDEEKSICFLELNGSITRDEMDSNANRIVKCWNMHDELVESLQNLLQINESNDDFDTKVSNMVIAIEKAKQVIKKATS